MIDNLSAMDDIGQLLDEVRRTVDEALERYVPSGDVEPIRLHKAVRWSLFAGGKRIRPAIVFTSGQVFGASVEDLTATAAAVEMIHTYSLIHDDLPAMDDDDLRRGKATCHKQFDEATAILAGDVLQSLAYAAIAGDTKIDAEVRVRLVEMIAAAAGSPEGMVAGQQLDLEAEGRQLSIFDIERIHLRKTGALISAAAMAGAMIGNATKAEIEVVGNFSRKLGLLFQITDDLLDLTEATESLGKTAGKDISANKATYPKLLGIDGARGLAGQTFQQAFAELKMIDRDTRGLLDIAEMVLHRRR
jgi:geranylgeranyl pyrophosphate synthase